MTPALRCWGCGHRFGRRSRSVLLFGNDVALCQDCADDPAVHRRLFVGCTQNHVPRAHDCAVVSLGRAIQVIYPNPA